MNAADGCNLRVEAADDSAGALAARDQVGVLSSRCSIERQHLSRKCSEDLVRSALSWSLRRPSANRSMPYLTSATVTAVVHKPATR